MKSECLSSPAQPGRSFLLSKWVTMKVRQCIWAFILAGVFLSSFSISEVSAQRRVFVATVPGVVYFPPGPVYPYYYNPYVMALPAYGILPPPLATMNMIYRYDAVFYGVQ